MLLKELLHAWRQIGEEVGWNATRLEQLLELGHASRVLLIGLFIAVLSGAWLIVLLLLLLLILIAALIRHSLTSVASRLE